MTKIQTEWLANNSVRYARVGTGGRCVDTFSRGIYYVSVDFNRNTICMCRTAGPTTRVCEGVYNTLKDALRALTKTDATEVAPKYDSF